MSTEQMLKEFMIHQSKQNEKVYITLENITKLVDLVNHRVDKEINTRD